MVAPLAAVTRMVTVLLPETKPVRPRMLTEAPASAAVALTLTAVLPVARVMVLPTVVAAPFTTNVARSVLLLSGVT